MTAHVSKVGQARRLATERHAGQMYGKFPYIKHLQDVADILVEFEFGPILQAAGWLHDIVEDTEISGREILKLFGAQIHRLVMAKTVMSSVGNRRQRLAALGEQLREEPGAVPLALADRLAHARHGGMNKMYAKEHSLFRQTIGPLIDPDGEASMAMLAEIDSILAPDLFP